MIAYAQSTGYPVEKILALLDEENSTPLHSAVHAGYTEVVEVLMKYGASPTAMKGDQPSPLHQAAFLGSISVLKALGKQCTLDQLETLNSDDRTPLHYAAFSSRNVECVQYFIERGCNVNHLSHDRHGGGTPLIATVCSGGLASFKVLLKNGANPLLQMNDGSNALHLAIQKGRKSIIKELLALPSDIAKELVMSRNNEGMNALHYAIINNQFEVVQDIIMKRELCCCTKTNENYNIVHLAADNGNPRMMSLVLSQLESFNLVNERNKSGRTALHLAAGKGHLKCVELLLDKGAIIHRCHYGCSPFLHACHKGFSDVARVLLKAHPFQLNWLNDDGDSALHVTAKAGHAAVVKMLLDFGIAIIHNADHESFLDIAIKNGNKDIALVAVQHSRWEECLKLISPKHPSPMLFLVERMSDVAKVVLDHCLTTSSFHLEHSDYWMRYDFQFLVEKSFSRLEHDKGYDQYDYDGSISVKKKQLVIERRDPLSILRSMLRYKRLICLTHPVLVEFLKYKWQLYGKKFLSLRLLLTLLLVILLSVFIGSSNPPRDFGSEYGTDSIGVNITNSEGEPNGSGLRIAILILCSCETLLSCCTIYLVVRLRQAFGQILPVIYFSACSIVSIYVFLIPPNPIWEAGVVAIISTWLYMICFIQFYKGIGIYVIMLLEVTFSLLRVIIFAVLMFVAFGLAFHILIGEISQYSTPGRAMFTVLVSMMDRIDTEEIVDKDSMGILSYPGLTYISIIVMSFLLPVIMINLFIGLAVGDIEKVRENATVTQRQLQIALYTFVDPIVSFFAPHFVNREFIIVAPNKHRWFTNKWLKWVWILWRSSVSAVSLAENNTEETDKYIEQELRISKMQTTMMEMENQLHMLIEQQQKQMEQQQKQMEQQQKQMEFTNNILDLLKERNDVH